MVVWAVGFVQAEHTVVLERPLVSAEAEISGEVLTDGETSDAVILADSSWAQPADAVVSLDMIPCESCRAAAKQAVVVKVCVGKESICVLPRDEVWMLSLRTLSTSTGCCKACRSSESYEFSTERLVGGQWRPDDLSALAASHQADTSLQTILMVHGNNTDRRWAITRGMQFYDRLIGKATGHRPSVRLLVLHWDSEKIRLRPLPDYKIKSARAASLGSPVAFLLNELDGPRPLLVGYSLGVQVILSSMGEMAASSPTDCLGYRMALVAPALDPIYANNGLATVPGNPCIADAELFINHNDRVVRASQFVSRKENDNPAVEPTLVGLLNKGLVDAERFRMFDVTKEVRNGHSMINYLKSPQLQQKMIELLRATVDDARPQTRVASSE